MLTTLTILLVWGAAIVLVLAFFRGSDERRLDRQAREIAERAERGERYMRVED